MKNISDFSAGIAFWASEVHVDCIFTVVKIKVRIMRETRELEGLVES